jgi:hypothetical protein
MRTVPLLLVSCLIAICFGCEVGPRSGRGFRLPDGDVERGALAFRELGCQRCHDVIGEPAAPEGDRSDVIVTLGGEVTRIEAYGELVTSIINPSHEISPRYSREQVAEGNESKMENFNDQMTVDQLIDLTAFLQSKYKIRYSPLHFP